MLALTTRLSSWAPPSWPATSGLASGRPLPDLTVLACSLPQSYGIEAAFVCCLIVLYIQDLLLWKAALLWTWFYSVCQSDLALLLSATCLSVKVRVCIADCNTVEVECGLQLKMTALGRYIKEQHSKLFISRLQHSEHDQRLLLNPRSHVRCPFLSEVLRMLQHDPSSSSVPIVLRCYHKQL